MHRADGKALPLEHKVSIVEARVPLSSAMKDEPPRLPKVRPSFFHTFHH